MYYKIQKFLKNWLDIIAAGTGLILLVVPFMIIALLIKFGSKGPVFYKSERSGTNGHLIYIYKFRTMIDNAINMGAGIEIEKDDVRITKSGKFLRDWSLDELPQLINILRGELSLVGPRPAVPHQVEKYSDFEKKRLLVKPGITGWAQVNGRNLLPWKERIKQDIWYMENWSLWLDLKILFMTPKAILSKEGLYGENGEVKDY